MALRFTSCFSNGAPTDPRRHGLHQPRSRPPRLHRRLLPLLAMAPSPATRSPSQPNRQLQRVDAVEHLTTWLRSLGHRPCNLHLHRFPPDSTFQGFGTIAGEGGILEGQEIVQVPLRAFMSEETALACPHVGPLIKKAALTPWQALCLHLLFERAKGCKSMWYPYISLLPTEVEMVEQHPLLWPQELCEELLSGSPMLAKLKERTNTCKEDHEAILSAGARVLTSFSDGTDSITNEMSMRWAAAILLSRAFSLDLDKENDDSLWTDGGDSVVLVPWADMLNHSSSAGRESCLKYDHSRGIAYLSAHKSYKEGEQVFDSYGPNLSPSQLLLDYGFVDEENQNYCVDLPAAILGPTRSTKNKALLDAIGLPADGAVFPVTEAGVDKSILAWARAAFASEKELMAAGWDSESDKGSYHKAGIAMAYFDEPISRENESQVLKTLLSACGTVLQGYPTVIEEDPTFLDIQKNNQTKVKRLSFIHIQAERAIVSEKRALRAAWKKIYVMLKKLEKGDKLYKKINIRQQEG